MIVLKILFWLIAGTFGFLVVWLLFFGICTLFAKKDYEYEKDSSFYRFLLYATTDLVLLLTRVRPHVHGAELLPKGERFLLVSNHVSDYDPFVTWHAFSRHQLAFISKPENMVLPFVGRLANRCLFMAIDRENPRKAMHTINRAAMLLKNDACSVCVYPEGTRNKTENLLLPFHNGVFKIAQKANVPVVVAAVTGTKNIKKNFPLHHSDVNIDILDVIPVEFIKENRNTDIIGQRVFETILNHIKK